jgi:hypothetical protein
MREKYLPEQRAIAVAEELAAFLRIEAVDDKGRFSVARGAGAWLMAPEDSLCVVNDQPVGNPKRKV